MEIKPQTKPLSAAEADTEVLTVGGWLQTVLPQLKSKSFFKKQPGWPISKSPTSTSLAPSHTSSLPTITPKEPLLPQFPSHQGNHLQILKTSWRFPASMPSHYLPLTLECHSSKLSSRKLLVSITPDPIFLGRLCSPHKKRRIPFSSLCSLIFYNLIITVLITYHHVSYSLGHKLPRKRT